MTTTANAETRPSEPDAEQVSSFLKQHPRFFSDRPGLLAELQLSHSSGSAVSLIERQVQVLRGQNQDLKNKLMELVDIARDNDRLNERMHQMTLDLLQAGSLIELLDTLENHLRNEFSADTITLHLPGLDEVLQRETGASNLVIDDALRTLFPAPLTEGKPLCGRIRQEQLEFLFHDQAAAIESVAVIPLGKCAEAGLLSIGSREVNRFSSSMGTLFLSHLGALLTRLLNMHR
ncbi:MAG: DUF484 family protein [Gammaproteobacteria bacterium]|nr:MAG: DUF484 family protein [Gammaproteobacteria bacterium]